MSVFVLFLKLALGGLFVLAAFAKLVNRDGSRRAISDFDIPKALVYPVSVLLPLIELLVAFLLLVPKSAFWGAMGAMALLLCFTAVIIISLARGKKPDCHCFGQLNSTPVGWQTLLRNSLFAAAAGFVLWETGNNTDSSVLKTIDDWSQNASVAGPLLIIMLVAITVQTWLIFHLFAQHGRLLVLMDKLEASPGFNGRFGEKAQEETPAGLPIGSPAPLFELPLTSGNNATLTGLRERGKPVLLIFSEPRCKPCNALLPEIAQWDRSHADKFTVALVSRGTIEDNRSKLAPFGLTNVFLQKDREVAEQFLVKGTPTGVLIKADGSIGSSLAVGPQAITGLVANATRINPAGNEPPPVKNGVHKLRIGQIPPWFQLPALNGGVFEPDDLKNHAAVLIFWNPKCGFCTRMLPQIKAQEDKPNGTSPRMVVVSTGNVEANQAMRLRSTVLLDGNFKVGAMFGASGTPSAILIDSNGKIASGLAVGAQNVLALVGA